MSRVLIDTQALIWFAQDASVLSKPAVSLVDDPMTERLASVCQRVGNGDQKSRLTLVGQPAQFVRALKANQIELVPVTPDDALGVADLPAGEHKDPFDRLIAAQCLRHDFTLVSSDKAFDAYGVRRIQLRSR